MSSSPEPQTYAIGDLHGEVTLLRQLLANLPYREHDTLVFLGDYVDRGEDSIAVIRDLQALKAKHPHTIFLRGNHEDAWLEMWDGARFDFPAEIGGALDTWDEYAGNPPAEMGHFIESTIISYEDDFAYYLHAGATPKRTVAETPDILKMWGDFDFFESDYDWGKPIVCGHWHLDEPLITPTKICVDTGASETGVLTAIRLPDRAIFQARR